MTNVTILAVTRLGTGVCVAGITDEGAWVRPTRPRSKDWRQLDYEDCKDRSGHWVVRKGHVVAMDLVKPIPAGAHVEDWQTGRRPPKLVGRLPEGEYRAFCAEFAETSTAPIRRARARRSLMLVHPDQIRSFSFDIETGRTGRARYTPRCDFRLGWRRYPNVAISDAEWRHYGRGWRESRGGDCRIAGEEVLDGLGADDCWLALGRNEYRSTVYLMVVGVHLFPPRRFEMDFRR